MKQWYASLSVLEYVYFYIGIVATFFLLLQILMMVFSLDNDFDLDGDGEIDVDADSGVSIFTIKSLTAFFAVGSWAGLLLSQLVPKYPAVSVVVGVVAGLCAMFTVVFTIKGILKLQCNGNMQMDKLVGRQATVYVSIPPHREGHGKITLEAQGKFTELDAITDEEERISVDTPVYIAEVIEEIVVVKRNKEV